MTFAFPLEFYKSRDLKNNITLLKIYRDNVFKHAFYRIELSQSITELLKLRERINFLLDLYLFSFQISKYFFLFIFCIICLDIYPEFILIYIYVLKVYFVFIAMNRINF